MSEENTVSPAPASSEAPSSPRKWTDNPVVRQCLVALGFVLIALTPIVGPIPGPGGVIVFAAGAGLVIKYSGWAKRAYVRFKRRHPRKGSWADWSLRRASHRRREERSKQADAGELPLGD